MNNNRAISNKRAPNIPPRPRQSLVQAAMIQQQPPNNVLLFPSVENRLKMFQDTTVSHGAKKMMQTPLCDADKCGLYSSYASCQYFCYEHFKLFLVELLRNPDRVFFTKPGLLFGDKTVEIDIVKSKEINPIFKQITVLAPNGYATVLDFQSPVNAQLNDMLNCFSTPAMCTNLPFLEFQVHVGIQLKSKIPSHEYILNGWDRPNNTWLASSQYWKISPNFAYLSLDYSIRINDNKHKARFQIQPSSSVLDKRIDEIVRNQEQYVKGLYTLVDNYFTPILAQPHIFYVDDTLTELITELETHIHSLAEYHLLFLNNLQIQQSANGIIRSLYNYLGTNLAYQHLVQLYIEFDKNYAYLNQWLQKNPKSKYYTFLIAPIPGDPKTNTPPQENIFNRLMLRVFTAQVANYELYLKELQKSFGVNDLNKNIVESTLNNIHQILITVNGNRPSYTR